MKPSKAPQPGFAAKIPRAPKNARTKGAEFLAGVSLLIGGMEVAVAVPIVQTKTQESSSARTTTLSGWDQFNSSLGTLNSVSIALTDWDVFGETMDAVFVTQPFTDSTLSFSVNELANVNTAFESFDTAKSNDQESPAQISIAKSISPALTVPSDWIGTSTFDLVASMNTVCWEGNESYNCFNPERSSWQGQFTLTYDYTPTQPPGPSIPEPAGLALTGLGLAMLGVQRRRKAAKS